MSSPTNNPPKPIIKRPNYMFEYEHERKEKRIGRGFSLGELEKVGLSVEKARKLGIYVDKRRKSVHEENIEALKKFLEEFKQKEQKT